MVALTALLIPIGLLASAEHREAEAFTVWMLLLESAVIGVFLALDAIVFFMFFEFVLVPMYFLIAGWGHGNRRYAAMKFFLFTMAGSAFLFVGILVGRVLAPARHRPAHVRRSRRSPTGRRRSDICRRRPAKALFLAFAIGFAVKVPLVPVPHVAARRAHRRADRGFGGAGRRDAEDGHLRVLALRGPVLPAGRGRPRADPARAGGDRHHLRRDRRRDATEPETDHRVLVGRAPRLRRARHRSRSRSRASRAALFTMVSHGLTTGALFLLVGMLYDRRHTYEISRVPRACGRSCPSSAACSSPRRSRRSGCPGFSGFVGEFLSLLGAFLTSRWYVVVAATGVILAAVYLLWAVQRAFTGEPDEENAATPEIGVPRARARSCRCSACRCSSASTRSRCSTACEPSVQRARARTSRRTATTRRRPSQRGSGGVGASCTRVPVRPPLTDEAAKTCVRRRPASDRRRSARHARSRTRRSTGSRSRRRSRCSRPRSIDRARPVADPPRPARARGVAAHRDRGRRRVGAVRRSSNGRSCTATVRTRRSAGMVAVDGFARVRRSA